MSPRNSSIDSKDLEILKSELRLEMEHKLDEREEKIRGLIPTIPKLTLPKEFWWAIAVLVPLIGAFFWFSINSSVTVSKGLSDLRVKVAQIEYNNQRTAKISKIMYTKLRSKFDWRSLKSITSNINPTNTINTNR